MAFRNTPYQLIYLWCHGQRSGKQNPEFFFNNIGCQIKIILNHSIESLRARFLNHDNSFLEELAKNHSYNCILLLNRKYDCPEETGKDIFTDALLQLRTVIIQRKIEVLKQPKNYLLGICVNLYKSHLRKENRGNKHENGIRLSLYDENPNYLDDITNQENRKEIMKITMSSFNALDEPCQRLIKMFYVDELNMKQIAEEMGFSNDKVAKTTKSRCYKKWVNKVKALTEKNYVE